MAIENKRIKVSELDFDEIKTNLKSYLRAQSEFTDYDFEGSGMSILLDVLAYNTHYNALYTNLAVNEMFLDSAAKRSSLASISNLLGYTPKSAIAPRALVNVVVTNPPGAPPSLSLPIKQPFAVNTTDSTGTSIGAIFHNPSAHAAQRSETGTYVFRNVELIEGKPLSFIYAVQENQKFIIPNENVDITTLVVRVQESSEDLTSTVYQPSQSIVNNTRESKVYYLREIEDQQYEVFFGDDVISYKPRPGNIVILEYFVTTKTQANGARVFTYAGAGIGGGVVTTQTLQIAGGGAEPESNDSIRFNAPKLFSAQNRAVTSEDYKIILPKIYPNIDTLSVWGGEENDPPIYGKVFICIKPKTGLVLSTAAKLFITEELLKPRNVVSITPTIVDPTFINVILDISFYYNPVKSKFPEESLKQIVKDVIVDYNRNVLQNFDSVFRMSNVQRLIEEADGSIVSSVAKLKITRDVVPNFGFESSYTINLYNPIYNEPGTTAGSNVTSSGFNITGNPFLFFFDDDTFGNLRLFYLSQDGTKVYTNNNAGTVDYASGKIVITSLNVSSAPNNIITFTVEPSSYDVVSVRDQLVRIAEDKILLSAIPDKVASSEFVSGSNYIFTPNR
jgi:hypothetical protein